LWAIYAFLDTLNLYLGVFLYLFSFFVLGGCEQTKLKEELFMLKKVVLVMLTALLIFIVPVSAQEDVMELDEVVVTASRYQESIMETPVSIEVIDQEEIEESTARNLAELLETAAGIHIKDNGGLTGKSDILMRGFRGDQILILLDGQPYNNPNSGEIDLKDIPKNIIQKIEVLKSSSSAVYGANAMGGVINIITKSGGEAATDLSLALGSYNTQNYNLSHSFDFNSNSILLMYDYLKSDGHRESNSYIDRKDIFLKYNYDFSNFTDIKLTLRYNDTDKDYPGSTIYPSNGNMKNINKNINLAVEQKYESKDRDITLFLNEKNISALTIPSSYQTDADTHKLGLNLKEIRYFNRHTLSYGLDIIENKVKAETTYAEYDEENYNTGVFIQDRFQLNSKNIIDFGFRYDDHQKYGSNFSPKLAYLYRINDNLNFVFNGSESFRAPSFIELYGSGGNPDLDVEQSRSLDIGLKYNKNNCKREIFFFKRDITDMIAYNGQFMTDNIESVSINGVEIITSRQVNNWNFDFNYTYLDAENENSKQRLLNMPYHKLGLNLGYKINDYKISLNNNYTGETEDYGGVNVDSYFISDLKLSKSIFENSKLSVEINNLFDKDYEVVDGYPMPGRNFMVNLGTKF
jgi:outer membrane receptor for ferrienterochelin and colicins